MGYLSFDASVKIHRSGRYTSTKTSKSGHGGINGYIRHIDRGTDKKNGCEVNHSNPDIHAEYTLENESFYKDSEGVWQRTNTSKDMVCAVNRRIQYAQEHNARISDKGKNDTVIVRPLVVQLDNDAIAQHQDTWQWDVLGITEELFGKDNIIAFSLHKDETNPHLHIIFTPCYESKTPTGEIRCAISQTKFFKNPKQLAGLHRQMRTALQEKGYEIALENKPIEEQLAGYTDKDGIWHQQGLTPEHLKQLSDKESNLKRGELNMNMKMEELNKLERTLKQMEFTTKARQNELRREDEELQTRQALLSNQQDSVQLQMQTLAFEKMSVQKMRQEAEELLQQATESVQVCNKILNEEKNLNYGFMEFLRVYSEKTKRPYKDAVENLYKKYQQYRRESMSDWQLEMTRIREERKRNGKVNCDVNIIDTDSTQRGYEMSL